MAFTRQEMRIIGLEKLRKRLSAIRALPKTIADDPRIKEELIKRTERRFETKKGPDGRRWKALSRKFFLRKENQDRRDILVDTGALSQSIGLTGRRGTSTGLGFRIGVIDPRQVAKGAFHQLGGRSALTGGRVAARPFLGVSKEDVTIVERLLKRIAKEKGL